MFLALEIFAFFYNYSKIIYIISQRLIRLWRKSMDLG